MVICYKEDVGWVAECLGPMSGHQKQKAREIQPKKLDEQPSPNEVKPIIQNKVKRESSVPLKELELNITKAKRKKGCKGSKVSGKENTTMDGRVAATATQPRRGQ